MANSVNADFKDMPDENLYAFCKKGDEAAWSYVYGFVLGITRWKRWNLIDTAEDVTQQVIVSLIEKGLGMVKEPKQFRAFVKRVTINRILDSYKGRQAVALPDDDRGVAALMNHDSEGHQTGSVAEDKIVHDEIVEVSLGIIECLPPYCRELMKLYLEYQIGRVESYREMADRLSLSINTVSVQIKRCLEGMRKHRDFKVLVECR